ncbi:DUF4347 domain-containing protein [Pseudomonas citronellolis]|uniref:DUF4347 domain-containing protein n=1 Tax=Pseudomonas citronellolis TaxID=53408 RepID=UPI0023E38B3B|nr:DUF4347 domain-containing protein [Pseudomonas citronellolis]MDF3932364.1 DUF4347 domain-containing protein [Pseudomonas citronellolis]
MQWIKRVFRAADSRPVALQSAQAPLIVALEPRMMFDGAAVASAAEAAKPEAAPAQADAAQGSHADASDSHDTATAAPPAAATSDQRHEIVFVDSNVADYQQLVADAKPGTEVVVLDASGNGLQQMADYLRGREGIDAIHVISHGQAGEVRFGSLVLSEANLSSYQALLAELGQSLSADGDLLLYGCDVGEGAAGSAFVKALADATGADVAASSDPTGSAALGGDWALETSSGSIETAALFAGGQASGWDHLLAYKAFPTDKTYSESAQGQDVDAYTTNAEQSRDLFLLNKTGTYTFSGHVESGGPNDATDVIPVELPNGAYISSYTLTVNNVVISSGTSFTVENLSDSTFFRQTGMTTQTVNNAIQSGLYSFTIGNGTVVADYVLTLDVVVPNVAPTVALSGGSSAYVEGNNVTSTVAVDSGLTLSDPDNTTLASATVSIGSGYHSDQDVLGFTANVSNFGNITGSYNGATGVLTLTSSNATATLAQWQAALRSVTYSNSSDTPDTSSRAISITVNDGVADSATVTRSVTVASTNDTPVVTASGGNTAFTEGNDVTSTPVAVDSGITVTDRDNTSLVSGSVAITGGFQSGQDVLAFTNNPATMGNIVGSYSAASGILSLSSAGGTANLAQWQAALRSITYSNSSDAPNTANRTVSFSVNDGSTSSVAATRTVTVTAVNDTPVVSASGGSAAFVEGNNVTSTPVVVDSGIGVSDLDSGTLASASVSITGNLHTAEDVLGFSNTNSTLFGNITSSYNAGTGVLSLTSAGGIATLAQWQNALSSVTYTNTSEAPNTANRTISFAVNDGSTTSTAATRTLTVTAVNDTPVNSASGGSAAFVESSSGVSTPVAVDSGFTVSDADNTTLASAKVSVTGNFHSDQDVLGFTNTSSSTFGNIVASYNAGNGELTLTSSNATATLAQWQAALRAVTYTNSSGEPNTATRTLSFVTNDGASDSNTVTRTLTVTAVNTTPVVTTDAGSAAFVAGDNVASTPVAIDSGLTISDPDNTTLSSATVSITGNFHAGEDILSFSNDGLTMGNIVASFDAATGVMTLTSASGTATLAQWQAALRAVTYTDTAVTPNNATRTISFTVNDGTDDSATSTRTVTVTDTDQTPILSSSGGGATYVRGAAAVAVDSDITVSDLDNTTLASARVSITGNFQAGDVLSFINTGNITGSYNAGTGVLTLTSSGASASLAQWQAALSSVAFSNASTANGSTRTISFTVSDGTKDSAVLTSTVDVQVNPMVQSVSAGSANGAYKAGDTLTISVTFDQAVTVDSTGGLPTLLLETGLVDRQAIYVSGSGTNTLVFSYTVQAGDRSADLDVASSTALSLNGGSIGNATTGVATLTLPAPGAAGSLGANADIVVDGVAPTVTSVGVPASGTYGIGQNLDFTVNYGESVVVDTTGGTPRLAITLDTGGTVYASYLSGSGGSALVFRLTVASGQLDSNGISVGGVVDSNGGSLRDAAGNAAVATLNSVASTASVLVDGVAPSATSIVRVDPEVSGGSTLSFQVTFSEAVSGVDVSDFTLVGSGSASGTIRSITGSGNSFVVVVDNVSGDGTLRLDLNSSATGIADQAGNAIAGGATGQAYVIDHSAPLVQSVDVPGAGSYKAGDVLSFTVNSNEAVIVDSSGGTPRLALDIGGRTVYANYASGSGSGALVFQYQVQAGDNDADGIQVLGVQANGGSLRDGAGNAMNTSLNGVADSHQVLVDTQAPSSTGVQLPADGRYTPGQTLEFTVDYNEAVQVDSSGGVPRIAITLDRGVVVYADYVSGSGSNQLVFAYTVQAGQSDLNGIQLDGQVQANGGRISDVAGNAANLALGGVPSTSGLLVQGAVSDGDPQFRTDQGVRPAAPGGTGTGVVPPAPPAIVVGPPVLGQPPLLDSSNRGAAQSGFSSLFRDAPAQSQFAQIFSSDSGHGDGSGNGFLGFGGGDGGVFTSSTLSSVFGAAREGEEQALSAFDKRHGDVAGGLRGVFGAPGLGQQLHEINQREQRQVADLARAIGELGREGPAA